MRIQRVSPCDKRFRVKFKECESWFISPHETESQALAWAERNKARLIRRATTETSFAVLGAGFFDRDGPWDKEQASHGWDRIDATLTIYQGYLSNLFLPEFGSRKVDDFTTAEIHDIVGGFCRLNGQPYSRASRNKILYALSLMYEYWMTHGIVDSNPAKEVLRYSKRPEKPRSALPREVLEKLCPATHGAAVKLYGSPMMICFFFAMNDTGARPGELRALRWGQIDFEKRFAAIRTAIESGTADKVKTTKTGIVRPAYFSERTIQELRIWREQSHCPDDMDFVFVAPRRKAPVSEAMILKIFKSVLEQLGYEGRGWTPYYLRHSFGTYKMEILPQDDIERLMGHASSITTKAYQHPDDETVYRSGRDIQERLDEERE